MRVLIAILVAIFGLAASVGCARTAPDPGDNGGTQADVAPAVDGSAADAGGVLRDDGCPISPTALPRPCTDTGKRCTYIEACLQPFPATGTVYECMGSGPYTQSWQASPVDCESFTGLDGCPLGPPKAISCTTPGLRCIYYAYTCSTSGGRVAPYECRAADGGAIWVALPREDCPAK